MDHHQSTTRGSNWGKGQSSDRTTNVPANPNNTNAQQRSIAEDKNESLPMYNINKVMRSAIMERGRITEEAKVTVQECVSKFIRHVTTAANQKCHGDIRKIVTAEDIISAMGTLGFDDYVEPLTAYLNKKREADPKHKAKRYLPITGNLHVSSDPYMAYMAPPFPQFENFAMFNDAGNWLGNVAFGNQVPFRNAAYGNAAFGNEGTYGNGAYGNAAAYGNHNAAAYGIEGAYGNAAANGNEGANDNAAANDDDGETSSNIEYITRRPSN